MVQCSNVLLNTVSYSMYFKGCRFFMIRVNCLVIRVNNVDYQLSLIMNCIILLFIIFRNCIYFAFSVTSCFVLWIQLSARWRESRRNCLFIYLDDRGGRNIPNWLFILSREPSGVHTRLIFMISRLDSITPMRLTSYIFVRSREF